MQILHAEEVRNSAVASCVGDENGYYIRDEFASNRLVLESIAPGSTILADLEEVDASSCRVIQSPRSASGSPFDRAISATPVGGAVLFEMAVSSAQELDMVTLPGTENVWKEDSVYSDSSIVRTVFPFQRQSVDCHACTGEATMGFSVWQAGAPVSYTPSARYQLSFLSEILEEFIKWTEDSSSPVVLSSMSVEGGQEVFVPFAIKVPCDVCVPQTSAHSSNVGGILWIYVRGDQSFCAFEVVTPSTNR